ncbi:hypothetical protein HELRODRAFT_145772, partial [Helobdella robusta]|uniref:LRRCT domain-containing protein n=1 Tax=Helobdella robusta TaxID=6412 RepID=T1EJM9_HELRO
TLRKLSFQNNQIEYLQKGLFDGLNDLEEIILKNNKISSVHDDVFKSLKVLQELHLHSNFLTTVPRDFLKNDSRMLKHISLHNNSWDCSCGNKWLKQWM